jgi:hypothetical protein
MNHQTINLPQAGAGSLAPGGVQQQAPLQPQVMPELPPAAGLAVRPTSFAQYFADESKDPCQRQYARIMARFDAMSPYAPQSTTLFQQAVTTGEVTPQAYLFCASTNTEPRIYCAHLPSIYVSALEGTITPWDDHSFAFLGDLVQNLVSTIHFLNDAIDTVQVWTRTAEYMAQNLDELIVTPVFMPVQPNQADPTIQEITTRKVMYLPAVYVPLFLSASGYTIRQAWETLYPALQQRNELVICSALVHWLQAASTRTALPQELQIRQPLVAKTLIASPADEFLLKQRKCILHQAIPGLTAPPQSLETALSHMAAALIAQTNDTRQVRDQKASSDAEPKLLSDCFLVTSPVLMEYLQVQNEADLPLLWHRWANCSKRQEVQVMQDSLDVYARGLEAFSPSVTIITMHMVQDLLSFSFIGQSTKDTKTGLHPFMVSDGNAEFRRNNFQPPPKFSPGELGKLATQLAGVLAWKGWSEFFRSHFHHQYSSLLPNIQSIAHPAAPFLHRLASRGIPAPSAAPPWSLSHQDAAVARGPHPSATLHYSAFLLEDMYDYVLQGYWLVLPYSTIRGHPLLKFAPVGVVPQWV